MKLSLATAAALAALGAAPAFAEVTIGGIGATWVTTAGATLFNGAGPGNANGVEQVTAQSITWGAAPAGPAIAGSGRSGYTIQPNTATPFSPAEGQQFRLAQFTHDNRVVNLSYATLASATLSVTVGVKLEESDPYTYLSALYRFTHNETPNVEGTCPSGSVSICDDIVTFESLSEPETIEYNGAQYSFFLDTFVTESGARVDSFMTQEDMANNAWLVGSFRDITTGPPVNVPEIGAKGAVSALILVLGGTLVLTGARRRDQNSSLAA